MKLKQLVFLICICLRHGINPSKKNSDNSKKYQKRLSIKEKQWVVNNCHESARDYFKRMMNGN